MDTEQINEQGVREHGVREHGVREQGIREHGVREQGIREQGIRELRASLTEAVRRAAAGERTVVTTSGRPIAQLGPLDESAPALEQLLAAGALIAPRRTSAFRAPDPVQIWSGVRIDRALRELRG